MTPNIRSLGEAEIKIVIIVTSRTEDENEQSRVIKILKRNLGASSPVGQNEGPYIDRG